MAQIVPVLSFDSILCKVGKQMHSRSLTLPRYLNLTSRDVTKFSVEEKLQLIGYLRNNNYR